MWGISWLTDEIWISQEGICCTELFSDKRSTKPGRHFKELRYNPLICGKYKISLPAGIWIPVFFISNFRLVLNVVCFLLGNSPASELYMPTFRNTLFHLHRWIGVGWLCLRNVGVFIRRKKRLGSKMAWASRKEGDRVGVGPVTEQVVESNDPHGDHMNSGCSSRAFAVWILWTSVCFDCYPVTHTRDHPTLEALPVWRIRSSFWENGVISFRRSCKGWLCNRLTSTGFVVPKYGDDVE